MAIHHYTKAVTLPLILESGKIRFTRADCLDDKSEMPFKTTHVDPRNFFVSSWTHKASEQSGQWYRYADAHAGVRITMPDLPFEFQNINIDFYRESRRDEFAGKKVGIQLKDVVLPHSVSSMFGDGYVLSPCSGNMQDDFGGKVVYVPDPATHVKRFISNSTDGTTIVGGAQLARIKSTPWEDQAEYRFVLMAIAGPQLSYVESPSDYRTALYDLIEANAITARNMPPPAVVSIDLPIAAAALDRLVVTLGSNITEEDRNLVTQAVERYAPQAEIVGSRLVTR
ncbi:MAG TPA: hypothetical protein VIP51_15640 [Eoetvoesiella sp.]